MRIALVALALISSAAHAETTDADAIRAACLDYIEGYYTADAARMERALHPELAKRMVYRDEKGRPRLHQMSALTLVQATRDGGGKQTPAAEQQKDVTVLDVYQNAASAKIIASGWIDYLHLARWNGQWKIVNVLWELKPKPAAAH
jgi:hypothetical protein